MYEESIPQGKNISAITESTGAPNPGNHESESSNHTQEDDTPITPERRSASDILKNILPTIESGSKEESSPQLHSYTIEDYVDSQEHLKNIKRITAKEYLSMKEKESSEPGQFDKSQATKERPDWESHFPRDDSPEEQQKWQDFVHSFPSKRLQMNLESLREFSLRHQEISNSSSVQEQLTEYRHEKQNVLAEVAAYRHLERKESAVIAEIEALNAHALSLGFRSWPDPKQISDLEDMIASITRSKETILQTDGTIDELERRRWLDKKRQLEHGVLMTDQMKNVETKNLPSLITGEPLLLFGETGGAKTALAKHMAKEILSRLGKPDIEPEIISGHSEINSYTLMGKNELITDENGSTITSFLPGPLIRAMQEGVPVIIDEVNGIPPELLKRLNLILQLRPGDKYKVQEDNGLEITIKQGFSIIATMNEKSDRYKGVEDLSAEFSNRFTNTAKINYPDQDVVVGDVVPPELLELALLECTDMNSGKIEFSNLTSDQLIALVQVAHYTQAMYTQPASSADFRNYTGSEQLVDGQTALKKTVISPRAMVAMISKIQKGQGHYEISDVLSDFLESISEPSDRAIISQLFTDFGLIEAK
jgi:predicted component of type VI protein secretion system